LNLELLGWSRFTKNRVEGGTEVATSAEWHEDYGKMSEETLNFSRALKSLQEELEAVDWYNQRVEVTKDGQLRRILAHNRDEEIEHAMMALEYLRRINPVFDRHMRTYLFTEGDITEIEEKAED
jgi:ferritin-like protein